jgi:hypothetical protein
MVVVQIAAAHDLASFEQPVGRDAGLRPGTGFATADWITSYCTPLRDGPPS